MIVDLVSRYAIKVETQVKIPVPEVHVVGIDDFRNRASDDRPVVVEYCAVAGVVSELVEAIGTDAIKLKHVECSYWLAIDIAVDGRTSLTRTLRRASCQH